MEYIKIRFHFVETVEEALRVALSETKTASGTL